MTARGGGPAITVRALRPGDAADVAQAIVDSSIHHVALEPERYAVLDAATVAARYASGVQHPRGVPADERASLVAEVDGRVVGVVDIHVARPEGAHRPERYGFIEELAVAAPARSRGAGAALLRAAEAWAREHDCAYTALDYNARNDGAARFYRDRMGYRPAGVIVIRDLREPPTG
jgi:GNAT superfamily N-acetyltransferase